jgi:hypothetical protein
MTGRKPTATQSATQYTRSRSHHAMIRVFDAAGKVIESTNTRAISKSGDWNSAALLIVENCLRCWLAHFKLGPYFLEARPKRCNLLLQLIDFAMFF